MGKESKVGMYLCPNGYYPTLGGGCASAKNPFKRTPWFFRAEKAVGEWVNRDSDEGAHGASSSAEELEVGGPSRYDPTGRESRVSGPARVDHWDPPSSMKASADSALEGQTMHKVVQPMLF